ncbi:ribonuclease T [uncultured Sphingomonas sp.]|uniref:ribonuclease T2 family protein n=1 Tax=uncultured Sphingomonas sp. TaxID=158754 RepID=UPI0035C97279
MRPLIVAAMSLLVPGLAQAQALMCTAPAVPPVPRPDVPTSDQPTRLLAIGGYTLALSWVPQYCRTSGFSPSARFECASGNRFGFALHGLWPDGVGKEWPQYCAATALLPPATIRGVLCATPSAQLIQHEWAKHGTCTGMTADAYFARSTGLYRALSSPDMSVLSRRALTAGALAAAIATANPRLPANAVRVTTTRDGWLDELWLCLDKRYRYAQCRAGSGGVAPETRVRIWRGDR